MGDPKCDNLEGSCLNPQRKIAFERWNSISETNPHDKMRNWVERTNKWEGLVNVILAVERFHPCLTLTLSIIIPDHSVQQCHVIPSISAVKTIYCTSSNREDYWDEYRDEAHWAANLNAWPNVLSLGISKAVMNPLAAWRLPSSWSEAAMARDWFIPCHISSSPLLLHVCFTTSTARPIVAEAWSKRTLDLLVEHPPPKPKRTKKGSQILSRTRKDEQQ